MIDLKKLTIGTMMEYKGEWAYLQAYGENGDLYIYLVNKHKIEVITRDSKEQHLKPLKLTRTIVQKLGFKKNNPHFDKYLRSSVLIKLDEGLYKVYHLKDDILKYQVDIKYAHELQNIFNKLSCLEAIYEIRFIAP